MVSDKISGYLNGEFDYKDGSLVFSCSKIEINMKQGEVVSGSFFIEEQAGREISGRIYSTDIMLRCLIENFFGRRIEVPYTVDATGKMPGDVIKGEFQVISEAGEYVVPYVINVKHESMDSSLGDIKNLFHFTNLAKSNWDEAVKLFYHEDFFSILSGNDARYRSLYKGLTACGNPNRNLEEFLIGIHKKQPVRFEIDRSSFKLINPDSRTLHTVRLDRAGWGYSKLYAEADGEFIRLEKQVIRDDDFLGNTHEFHFYINENALHEGNNFGRIHFQHSYGSFDVDITVVSCPEGRTMNLSRKERRATYSLTRYYLDFRMKRLSAQKWIAQTKEVLEHYRNIETTGIDSSLFEAHLLITQENYNEAKWVLEHFMEDPEELDDTRYCYYLYLTTLYNKDEYYSRRISDRVMSIFNRDPFNWRIAWLLLYLAREINRSAASKWNFALEQVERGCQSPIFYLEALVILNSEPSVLLHLDDAQLRILQFGAKMNFISPELMQQITAIASRMKTCDRRLLQILMTLYERKPQEEALRVICLLLMKSERCDKESHIWYERGVEQNLPITKLYEYYMMSMDISVEQDIQKKALMYFSYQCELSGERKAYLYRYVVKNKNKLDELYDTYYPQIVQFISKQLYAGKINDKLAYLYQEILMKDMATPDNTQQFARFLFINRITVDNPRITSVIVLDDRLKEEMVYPVVGHCAHVQIFSNDHTILLQDQEGNRYFGTEEYQTECYFLPRKYASMVSEYASDSIAYNLYLCGDNREMLNITAKNASRCRYLIQADGIEEEFKKTMSMNLMTYYFENDEAEHLEELLSILDSADVLFNSRSEVVKYLSIYGLSEKAYEFTVAYGPDNVDAKTIVRFCTNLLEMGDCTESKEMTCMLYSAFERGKYNALVLEYLIRNYNGLAKNLRNIWKAAVSFDVDTYAICEKIILQTLETGAYIAEEGQIYRTFVSGGMKSDINRAYLSHKAYELLVHDSIEEEFVFDGIARLYQKSGNAPDVCMLAYLKFYNEKVSRMSEERKRLCAEFLRILYEEKGIFMPFFAKYSSVSAEAARLANAQLIEYKGNPESKAVIHYIISSEDEETGDYSREEMKNMFGGIFVKDFLLFFGETLQYYITEEYANKEMLTGSGTIQKSEALSEATTNRYTMINDIATATTLKDYSTARELLEEYDKKEFMTASLFRLQ